MSYKDYISDDEILEENDLDEEDFDEDDFDEEDYDDDREYEFKVVGVTFNNDDGTSRQEILRKIKNREEPFNRYINYTLRVYSFEGEPAVAVEANGIMIGNMPKEDARDVAENIERIESVSVRVYGGEGDKKYGARATLTLKKFVIPTAPKREVTLVTAPDPVLSNSPAIQINIKDVAQKVKITGMQLLSDIRIWMKNPISIIFISLMVVAITVIVILSSQSSKEIINPNEVVSNVSSMQTDKRLDITYETMYALARMVGFKNNIEFKSIVYSSDSGVFSAGAYSLDDDCAITFGFRSDSPDAKAKSIDVTIDCEKLTDDNVNIVGDAFEQLLRVLDSDAALNIGFSKIYKELSNDYQTNGIGGMYETEKLSFSYHVVNDDIVISIFPK